MRSMARAGDRKSTLKKDIFILTAISVSYLLVSSLLIGFKVEQLVLVGLANLLYFLTPISRKFVTGFSIFILFWVLYDFMRAFPNYWFNPVAIKSLYNAEKAIFGIRSNGIVLTPNEYWLMHSNAFLDVISGLFYLSWIPVPIAFSIFLFFRNRQQFIHFLLTFLLVNILGFIVYYLYPAAPPWYVQQYGVNFIEGTAGNTAGLVRFDEFFGITIFHALYAKGSNVFAAMPSLHSAYPLIVFYYALKNRLGWLAVSLFGIITAGIWFAAVYTSHHYLLDVLAGILCACIGILLFNWLLARKGAVYRAVERLVAAIQ